MKTKTVKASSKQLQKTMLAKDFMTPGEGKTLAEVFGSPGVMKSGPNAGTPAEDPTAKRLVQSYVGATVIAIRRMTESEMEAEGWDGGRVGGPLVVVFSNGATLYASRDSEGNGPGVLFGAMSDGTTIYVKEEGGEQNAVPTEG